MANELFSVANKRQVDEQNIYHQSGLLLNSDLSYLDANMLMMDGSEEVHVRLSSRLVLIDYFTKVSYPDNSIISLANVKYLVLFSDSLSDSPNDMQAKFEFRNAARAVTWSVECTLTAVELALLADFDRDGVVDKTPDQKGEWSWGTKGVGAVLLVNSDRDTAHPSLHFRDRLDRRVNGPMDLADMTPLVVRFSAPQGLDLTHAELRISTSDAAASRMRVFDISQSIPGPLVGPGYAVAQLPAQTGERQLVVEGLDYPDATFSGLITLALVLECAGVTYQGDGVVLRVAPWLALPNTQPVQRLYIAEMRDESNRTTINDIITLAKTAGVELVIVPPKINRDDTWLQDEIEIGYTSRPGKTIPVVLDSPRDRELDDFPEIMLLGPDFGYVTRSSGEPVNSLDSFGNLDCTPPHTGPQGSFPFGRIIFGGSQPDARKGRRMMKTVSDFLYAQQVQYPIELFSDWLTVGHIDEFMSFVPTSDDVGFRLVLASPIVAYQVLETLMANGHGEVLFMPGKRHERSVKDLLADRRLKDQNKKFQDHINNNKSILIREMGLSTSQIIHLPALYFANQGEGRADAYFPGMVNMQVLGKHLAIPKPFGPQVDGQCAFEAEVRRQFEPLGLMCHFIDTYEGYHLRLGEIHCGTNVIRKPFDTPWWHFIPK
ncbi:MAG: protein-arginine deiminase [Magnetococcales bacterium]|nr:protein-arginine deiminase [Magnetococcales bacterium]